MSNVAIEDRINQPAYYHREYENDLKGIKPKSTLFQKAERVGIIALPFISLYKPLGSVISLGMNSTRSFSCLMQTKEALTKGEAKEIGIALFQSSLAAAAVVGTIFGNFYGMAITSSHDVLINLYETLQHFSHGDYEKAFENFLQLANNSLYLTMLLHGSLEIVVISFVAQILIEAYKSQSSFRKFKNGDALDILEGIAHLAMAGIRSYQMQPQLKTLQFLRKLHENATQTNQNRRFISDNSLKAQNNKIINAVGTSESGHAKETENHSITSSKTPSSKTSFEELLEKKDFGKLQILILEKGFDANQRDSLGRPILYLCFLRENFIFCIENKIIQIMLTQGANPNAQFGDETVLHTLLQRCREFGGGYNEKYIHCAKELLEHGANLNLRYLSLTIPELCFKLFKRQGPSSSCYLDPFMDLFFSYGTDPNPYFRYAYDQEIKGNCGNLLNILLKYNLDLTGTNGQLLLSYFIEKKKTENVMKLIEKGAKPEAEHFSLALHFKKFDLVNFFKKSGLSDPNAALNAVRWKDLEMLKYLKESGFDVTQCKNGKLLLHLGSIETTQDLIAYLVYDCGCNPNELDEDNSCPLSEAVDFKNYSLFLFLLQCGANLDIQYKNYTELVGKEFVKKSIRKMIKSNYRPRVENHNHWNELGKYLLRNGYDWRK